MRGRRERGEVHKNKKETQLLSYSMNLANTPCEHQIHKTKKNTKHQQIRTEPDELKQKKQKENDKTFERKQKQKHRVIFI